MKREKTKAPWDELYSNFITRRYKRLIYLQGNLIMPEFLENIETITKLLNTIFQSKFGESPNVSPDDDVETFWKKVFPFLEGYWNYLITNKQSTDGFIRLWVWVAKWLKLKSEDPLVWFNRFHQERI